MSSTCLFREHRGSLDASMATQKTIAPTLAALRAVMFGDARPVPNLPDSDIKICWYSYDPRIGQDCWMVRIEGWGVCGWLSQPLQDHPYIDPRGRVTSQV